MSLVRRYSLRNALRQPTLNRRGFLWGAAGVSVGLPFLESVPHRSAWAADENPRFALFIGTANGVVQNRFWPTEEGALTDLSSEQNAAGALAGFEPWITFVQGIKYPGGNTGCTHATSYCEMYTGAPAEGSGNQATSTAPSIDTIVAPYLNPDGAEPLALYAGMKGGYINERLSFISAGEVRPAEGNPAQVYADLMRAGTAMTPDDAAAVDAMLEEVLVRRSSVIDFVSDDLQTLLGRSGLGAADRQRLELHLESLRDIELELGDSPVGTGTCRDDSLDLDAIAASEETYRARDAVEPITELQMQLAAFAFSCNLNRVATLQSGDGLDKSLYAVPSNDRQWDFHFISHRIQSDGATGDDPQAEAAHAEIDRVRLETFRRGLAKFDEHGLLDRSVIMWANQLADGPSGSFNNLPIILAGNAGGTLRTGMHLTNGVTQGALGLPSGARINNGDLLTTVAFALGVDETIGVAEGVLDDLLVS